MDSFWTEAVVMKNFIFFFASSNSYKSLMEPISARRTNFKNGLSKRSPIGF